MTRYIFKQHKCYQRFALYIALVLLYTKNGKWYSLITSICKFPLEVWFYVYCKSYPLRCIWFCVGSMYPNGAPNSACVRMDPSITRTHDGGRQSNNIPFKLTPSKDTGKNLGS